MLDKRSTLDVLEREGVAFELAEHPAVFTVEQARQAKIPFAAYGAKNLFLRDDRHRAHYLVCLPDEKRVSLREVQERIGSRRLSFASETDLAGLLGLTPRVGHAPRRPQRHPARGRGHPRRGARRSRERRRAPLRQHRDRPSRRARPHRPAWASRRPGSHYSVVVTGRGGGGGGRPPPRFRWPGVGCFFLVGGAGRRGPPPPALDPSGPYSSPLSALASITARRVGSSAFVSSSSVGMQVT